MLSWVRFEIGSGALCEGLWLSFSGLVVQHHQGLVFLVFVLGLAFGSSKGSNLLLRFWSECRLFRIQDLSVASFQGIWGYLFH